MAITAAPAICVQGLTKRYGHTLAVDHLTGHAPAASLGDAGTLRVLLGTGIYGALIGLLGMGLGTLLRSTAAAVSAVVAILYVLPALIVLLPTILQNTVEEYWPTQAGRAITQTVHLQHTLGPWIGTLDLAIFVAILLAAAAVRLIRTDA